MQRLPWWGAVLAVGTLTALLYLPTTGIVWPREGHAFGGKGGGGYGFKVAPGREWVHIYSIQHAEAESGVTVDEVIPVKKRGIGGSVEILDVRLAPRIPGRRALMPSIYWIDPDTDMTDCPNQPVIDPHGYEIPDNAAVFLAVRYRSLNPGSAKIGEFDVTYQEGNLHRRAGTGISQELKVLDKAATRPRDQWRNQCHKKEGSLILDVDDDYWNPR